LSKAAFAISREGEQKDVPAAGKTTVTYRVALLMETYVPVVGYAAYVPDYHIGVTGLANGFELLTSNTSAATSATATALNIPDGDIHVTAPANFETYTGRAWGGTQGFNNLFAYSDSNGGYQLTARTVGTPDSNTGYPFVSAPLQVVYPTPTDPSKDQVRVGMQPAAGSSNPGNVAISFYDGSNKIVTSYSFNFPKFGPVPGAFLASTTSSATVSGSNGTGSNDTPATLQERVNQMVTAGNVYSGAIDQQWTLSKQIICQKDVVRGVELGHGDLRLLALHGSDTNNAFVTHKDYANTAYPQAHSLQLSAGSANYIDQAQTTTSSTASLKTISRGTLVANTATAFFNSAGSSSCFVPQAPSAMVSATSRIASVSDFSNGIASESDGPHILKADEGNSSVAGMTWSMSTQYPYQNQLFPYDNRLSDAFSPNRQISSPVQLGTLPSQPFSSVPWQTLLFRPDFAGTAVHPGLKSPADHLLLDLFWMPVIDPYPISESLSTAGKVNMNYQIAPFTYINRSTAMIGALKSTQIEALPVDYAKDYKNTAYTPDPKKNRPPLSFLYPVDAAQTLLFFKEKFANTDPSRNIFKSASEICSIPLAPTHGVNTPVNTGHGFNTPTTPKYTVNIAGASDAASLRNRIQTFWSNNTLTGDNTLEAPYNALYPRLTTQSNTYTVYVRAQALQVGGPSTGGKFTNIQKRVTGEYRGSYEIERYIDLNDPSIPDFASPANASKTVYRYYKFRILSAKQFVP
ncbi:MAG: Verru_Chthon cassette protein A, partial [Chthoniobacteraceae bacterium]|nr:Verru_Chthon cassette protein A [Chthoniobacteraceae bacterium]